MESPSTITFVQPRHIYAPDEGQGHIYLSAPLMTFMAQLNVAGVSVEQMEFADENFESDRGKLDNADWVGINLVGAPYIPDVVGIIRNRLRSGARAILGGQIIDVLSDDEFSRLFQDIREDVEVVKGSGEKARQFFGVRHLPSAEEVSSIPVWEKISDEHMESYLSREVSFYLAQGCPYRCHYCQAANGRPEFYRDLDLAVADLRWLTEKAMSFGICELSIYLSNLDIFLTPQKLEQFLIEADDMAKELGFTYKFRGLAGISSTPRLDEGYLERCSQLGLVRVGLGLDGVTPHVWRKTGKVQNLSKKDQDKAHKCIESIKKVHEVGILPELLMVVGHDVEDFDATINDMKIAKQFVLDMIERFGVHVHPYLVKDLIPGAEAWDLPENRHLVDELIEHPEFFKDLDFAATPNRFSHPDPALRRAVRAYYLDFLRVLGRYPVASSEDMPFARAFGYSRKSLSEGNYDD